MDVAPALLLAEMEACRLGDVEAAEEMDADDRLEVGDAHLVEDAVAQDARVVDDAVDAAEGVEGATDDALGSFGLADTVRARHRHPTRALDLPHDGLGGAYILALALGTAAEIIDHHLAALGRGEKGDLAADAAAGPCDDDDLALEALLSPHRGFLPFMSSLPTGTLARRRRKRQREAAAVTDAPLDFVRIAVERHDVNALPLRDSRGSLRPVGLALEHFLGK